MPAHVVYSAVDDKTSCFSVYWNALLRNGLRFGGVIFSDDLSMEGATVAGGIADRAQAAWRAGCDMLLVCNSPEGVADLLESWRPDLDATRSARIARLMPTSAAPVTRGDDRYRAGVAFAKALADEKQLITKNTTTTTNTKNS